MQVLKEEMRSRIINAARAELSRAGWAEASMRAIARKAGCTVGNLYRYYKDREALFEAATDREHDLTIYASKALATGEALMEYLGTLPVADLVRIANGR